MTTRQRALVAIVPAGLALAAILYFNGERSRIAAMEVSLNAFVETPAFTDVRARCQTDPTKLGPVSGADASFEVFAYDGEFHPADSGAPVFSTDLADKMRGKISAVESYSSPEGGGVEMGMATPWRNGKCALILVRLARKP